MNNLKIEELKMEWLKILKIKMTILALCLTSLCFGHDLSELIDKCDFVEFKKTYEVSEVSNEKKVELLVRINCLIEEQLKSLKFFFGGAPPIKITYFAKKIFPGIFNLFGTLSLGTFCYAIWGVLKNLNDKKQVQAQYGRVAADFDINGWNQFKQLLDRIEVVNLRIGHGVIMLSGVSLFGIAYSVIAGKWIKSNLLAYKKYKKALKIRNLIQDSISIL